MKIEQKGRDKKLYNSRERAENLHLESDLRRATAAAAEIKLKLDDMF
jgi:hypothetical protein